VRQLIRLSAVALLAVAAVSGCSPDRASAPPATGGTGRTSLTVFAAASLAKSFTEIGERFKADNPGTDIEFSFAGSSDLVTQLTQGAAADVFASADTNNMDKASQAGLLTGAPVDFASNTLTIVVAPGNPKKITSFKDLARPGLLIAVCAPQVPCGSAARRVEQATGVALNPVTEESKVTDVLTKVTSGQADAGLVYVTDAQGAGDTVTAVVFPESAGAVNVYPIAVLKQAENAELARRFVEIVTGEAGREVLDAAGFGKP
jgi:molybdate transport system substrate-binding protein